MLGYTSITWNNGFLHFLKLKKMASWYSYLLKMYYSLIQKTTTFIILKLLGFTKKKKEREGGAGRTEREKGKKLNKDEMNRYKMDRGWRMEGKRRRRERRKGTEFIHPRPSAHGNWRNVGFGEKSSKAGKKNRPTSPWNGRSWLPGSPPSNPTCTGWWSPLTRQPFHYGFCFLSSPGLKQLGLHCSLPGRAAEVGWPPQ